MNRDEIQNMPAGAQTNELVATNIMGWISPNEPEPKCPACGVGVDRPKCFFDLGGYCPRHEVYAEWKANKYPPDYSEDISAAWEVVEKLQGITCGPIISLIYDGRWNCKIGLIECFADTAPLAICRTALLTVMEKQDAVEEDAGI